MTQLIFPYKWNCDFFYNLIWDNSFEQKLRTMKIKVYNFFFPIWKALVYHEDCLKKEIETHSSIFAWEIPWTEKSSRLQSMESQKSWIRLSKSDMT